MEKLYKAVDNSPRNVMFVGMNRWTICPLNASELCRDTDRSFCTIKRLVCSKVFHSVNFV